MSRRNDNGSTQRGLADAAAGVPPGGGETLLALARGAIGARWGATGPTADAAWLRRPGAAFVTLRHQGELRGCVGTIEARRPLADDVCANAVAAAFHDGRFRPLRCEEFDAARIEVSVLSAVEPLAFEGLEGALRALRPGLDGVLLEHGWHRATFLPQMWERFADPRRFLDQLLVKAGLPAGFWDDAVRLSRYTVASWHEPGRR